MVQTNGFRTYCVVRTVLLRIQIPSNLLGTALLAACLSIVAKPSTAQEAPLNPILDVGVVQRFGSESTDEITIKPDNGDTLTVEFKVGEQEQAITTTNEVKVEVVMQPLPEPKVTERLVLSTHRSFESAEDSASQWRSQGIEVEIAQPRQWQVWAKRETYGTPLLRRLLMQNLRSHGDQTAFLDTQVKQQQPQAAITVNGTRIQQDEVTFNTAKDQAEVSFNRTDHGQRRYAGTLRLQPNAYGTYTLVNQVPIETYLRGVVPHEIGAGAPPTTIEAQAVLARTYALRNLRRFTVDNYQLCADTQCQVYWGLNGVTPETDRAIAATRGQVLTYNNELVDALYSSTTGGITAPYEDVWDGSDRPYLKAVVDSVQNAWDISNAPLKDEENFRAFIGQKTGFNEQNWDMFRWRIENSLTDIANDVRSYLRSKQHPFADFTQIKELKVLERSAAGRVLKMSVLTDRGEIILEKDEILRALYAPNSTLFYLDPIYETASASASSSAPNKPTVEGSEPSAENPAKLTANSASVDSATVDSTSSSPAVSPQPAAAPVLKGYAFVGGGLGHGVGMSQTGAYHLGRIGWNNSQILSFYYPNTQIQLLTNAITFWRDPLSESTGTTISGLDR